MPRREDERPQQVEPGREAQPEGGPWRRTTQHDVDGEGPGSWGPDGRHALDPGWRADEPDAWENLPVDDPWRAFPGAGKQNRGFIERNWLGARRPEDREAKAHRRPDAVIREDVRERFTRSNIDAQDVDVRVEDGEVTLSGTVESRWDKRMLEDLVAEVPGVGEIQNELLTKSLSERAADAERAAEEPGEPVNP